MKHNILTSFRMRLALYVFLSCGLTFLTDGILILIFKFIMKHRNVLGKLIFLEQEMKIDFRLVDSPEWNTAVWIMLIIISVMLFFVYYIILSAPMVSYLKEILSGVERIKDGDLTQEIAIRSSGELTDLARAINTMQAELRNAIINEQNAEQMKDELVTNVAHDLRTPLTSVIGYLNLLQQSEELPKETQDKYIKIAYEKSLRMEGLVTDLFDFTRYGKGKMELSGGQVELRQFLEQLLDEFYPSLKEHQLECYKIFTPEKIYIDGDGELLARAFGNLMSNAIKYGAEGKQIRVELQTQPEQNLARVSITNYGRMIPKKDLDKVFDKFYRGDAARSTRGGTGLGLAIAKNIIEMHNGTIQVQSGSRGTVFEIIFRLNAEKG